MRDVERATRLLQLTFASDGPELLAPSAVAVLQAAGSRGLVSGDAAEGWPRPRRCGGTCGVRSAWSR